MFQPYKKLIQVSWLSIILLGIASTVFAHQYQVQGVITGLDGRYPVYIAVFDESHWVGDLKLSLNREVYAPRHIQNGQLRYGFHLPAGEYALIILEDRNGDGLQNYGGFLGQIPQEAFGFSRNFNPFRHWRKPRFDEVKHSVQGHTRLPTIQMLNRD
jgi:uncharacterized protein (DUF2141 family)